ncbi:uncharacterized protein LOC131437664 [Malaya genurostris]|uniref:uncharacterized protein LOC131437664 n=1 Tax=Malaya genurostris TaxID=325434 RepID=UPI0026F3DA97|nr:uncharacterized protein LOC131437664 [Malaya genurostris]
MEVRLFRRVGFIYAVLCFIGSAAGVIIFFKQLVDGGRYCDGFDCGDDGSEYIVYAALQMIMCSLSAVTCAFLKVGIDETEPKYICIYKAFMVTRNFILIVRWTFESVTLGVIQISGIDSPIVQEKQNLASALLVAISALFGLEMWIIDGIQRYVEGEYINEENVEIL